MRDGITAVAGVCVATGIGVADGDSVVEGVCVSAGTGVAVRMSGVLTPTFVDIVGVAAGWNGVALAGGKGCVVRAVAVERDKGAVIVAEAGRVCEGRVPVAGEDSTRRAVAASSALTAAVTEAAWTGVGVCSMPISNVPQAASSHKPDKTSTEQYRRKTDCDFIGTSLRLAPLHANGRQRDARMGQGDTNSQWNVS